MPINDDELAELERDVGAALVRGEDAELRVLGHGEISLVLGWPDDAPQWACKRLPPFGDRAAAAAYEATFHRYVGELAARGVDVVDSELRHVEASGGGVAVYCIQRVLAPDTLATHVVRTDPSRADAVFEALVDHVVEVVDERVGLDAQLSNWAVTESGLSYLDVTTPLLRTAEGLDELDTDVFLASLPWLLRWPVGRFVIPGVVERYHWPRTVVLDLAANLIKEQLDQHIPTVLRLAAGRVDPLLDEAEVRADYRSDARTWGALQAVRRVDRSWQRRVRGRTYPFLLPDRIDR